MSVHEEIQQDKALYNNILKECGVEDVVFEARRLSFYQEKLEDGIKKLDEEMKADSAGGEFDLQDFFEQVAELPAAMGNPSDANKIYLVVSQPVRDDKFDEIVGKIGDIWENDEDIIQGFSVLVNAQDGRQEIWDGRSDTYERDITLEEGQWLRSSL